MLTGNYDVAIVKFVNGYNNKLYSFALYKEDIDILIGDKVLCDTSCGMNIGVITDIIPFNEYDGADVQKEIICKVDFTNFEKRREERKRKKYLKSRLDKMVKNQEVMNLYEYFAASNEEMQSILNEYKELCK